MWTIGSGSGYVSLPIGSHPYTDYTWELPQKYLGKLLAHAFGWEALLGSGVLVRLRGICSPIRSACHRRMPNVRHITVEDGRA